MLHEGHVPEDAHVAQSEATSGELSLPGTPQRSAVSLQASPQIFSYREVLVVLLQIGADMRPAISVCACNARVHHAGFHNDRKVLMFGHCITGGCCGHKEPGSKAVCTGPHCFCVAAVRQ